MGETCERCGRPKIVPKPKTTAREAWESCDGTYLCRAAEYGYRYGRRDGIDEGVRLAKKHAAPHHDDMWGSGIDWTDVDAAAEKAKWGGHG